MLSDSGQISPKILQSHDINTGRWKHSLAKCSLQLQEEAKIVRMSGVIKKNIQKKPRCTWMQSDWSIYCLSGKTLKGMNRFGREAPEEQIFSFLEKTPFKKSLDIQEGKLEVCLWQNGEKSTKCIHSPYMLLSCDIS